MDEATMTKALDAALALTTLLTNAGVNYQEVIAAQNLAALEGRELNAAERQVFIDQAQAAIDRL